MMPGHAITAAAMNDFLQFRGGVFDGRCFVKRSRTIVLQRCIASLRYPIVPHRYRGNPIAASGLP